MCEMKRMFALLVASAGLLTGCPDTFLPSTPPSNKPVIHTYKVTPVMNTAPTSVSFQIHVSSPTGSTLSCRISAVGVPIPYSIGGDDSCGYYGIQVPIESGGTRTYRLVVTDSQGLSTSKDVTVNFASPVVPADPFNISLRFADDVPAWVVTDVTEAAQELEKLMLTGLPSANVNLPGTTLDGPVGAFSGVVDDVMLDVAMSFEATRPLVGTQRNVRADGTTITGDMLIRPYSWVIADEVAFLADRHMYSNSMTPESVHELAVGIFLEEMTHFLGLGAGQKWESHVQHIFTSVNVDGLIINSDKYVFVGPHSASIIPKILQPKEGTEIRDVDRNDPFAVSSLPYYVQAGSGIATYRVIDINGGTYSRYLNEGYLTTISRALLRDLGYNTTLPNGYEPGYFPGYPSG